MKPLLPLPLFYLGAWAITPLPLSTSSRWILDAEGHRVKLRCINWAGHMETNTLEGLHKRSIDDIANFVQSQGFNCVRMTYSIDHALDPNVKISDSFRAAAGSAGVSVDKTIGLFDQIVQIDPTLAAATTRDVYSAAVGALWKRDIMTILDNHVSKASWCCELTSNYSYICNVYNHLKFVLTRHQIR